MPLFAYSAVAGTGKKLRGVVKADSIYGAKEQLKKQKIFVVDLIPFEKRKIKKVLNSSMLLFFTRDLAQLLKAGLPLYESLTALEEKYVGHPVHPLFLDLSDQISRGAQLSDALRNYPDSFDHIYTSMVAAAEETGSLGRGFTELVQLLTKQAKLKKKIVSSLIYPLFLLSFCFLVVGALFFFLIPSMRPLFEERTLHPMTEAVLAISSYLQHYGWHILIGVVIVVIALCFFFHHPLGKKWAKVQALKIPVIGTTYGYSILVRICRAISVLLENGVNMIEALSLAKKLANHPSYEKLLSATQQRIIQGGTLSEELAKAWFIPKTVTRMVAMSEETGNAETMFLSIAEIYEEEVEKTLERFTSMLQPIILLFLAFVVGLVILSILLPLTDIGSFVDN